MTTPSEVKRDKHNHPTPHTPTPPPPYNVLISDQPPALRQSVAQYDRQIFQFCADEAQSRRTLVNFSIADGATYGTDITISRDAIALFFYLSFPLELREFAIENINQKTALGQHARLRHRMHMFVCYEEIYEDISDIKNNQVKIVMFPAERRLGDYLWID